MLVKCHFCNKPFQHYGNRTKYVWCKAKCMDLDKKKAKEAVERTNHEQSIQTSH